MRRRIIPIMLSLLFFLLVACGLPEAGIVQTTELMVRETSEASVKSLDANVVAGEVQIYADTLLDAFEVQFFIDDEHRSDAPVFTGTEAPFEFSVDTRNLEEGPHTMTVLVKRVSGGSELTSVDHATFVVNNSGDGTPNPDPSRGRGYSLRGDPSFNRANLDADARRWYDRLWAAIDNPNQKPNAMALASSDNTHNYGRYLHQHVASLLVAFRATGDLALLDEVDALAQAMRATLAPGWRSTKDGTDGQHDISDDFLIWPSRDGGGREHHGKDTWESNEIRTHAMVAQIAFALDANRDLQSPDGIPYGERADFWEEYLVEHFEAKWRERSEKIWPIFPFIDEVDISATWNEMLHYHYYMWRLTGRAAYEKEARRLTDVQFEHEFKVVDTARGEAYVWSRGLSSQTDSAPYLLPTVYFRAHVKNIVEYQMDGWYTWAERGVAERFATTLSTLIMDNGSEDFAVDVGGGVERAGIPPAPTKRRNPYGSQYWDRQHPSQHAASPYALLAGYDPTDRVATIEEEVYERLDSGNSPTDVHIPAGLLVYHVMH